MTDGLEALDLAGLRTPKAPPLDVLAPMANRSAARSLKGQPLTVDERFAFYQRVGYHPHGLFLPQDAVLRRAVEQRLWQEIGALPNEDQRLMAYHRFQQETAQWETIGLPGCWNGQQAVARSIAQFRITGWGRRAGKTDYAGHEGAAYLELRPGCIVWAAARTMKLVGRLFDAITPVIRSIGRKIVRWRDSRDERFLELDNGSRLEGVSLDNMAERDSAAGASVALAIVDEGAQVVKEAWTRGIYPPLTDRGGQGLVLSSFNGDDNWFYEQIDRVREGLPNWALFLLESYWNFYVHPQGRNSPALIQAQIDCDDPFEYLEQYCAIPRRGRNLVFPQYRSRVHTDATPASAFDKSRPVYVAGDPSGGANPYAVYAIQQYPDRAYQEHVVIDEYYVAGALGEDMTAECNHRPWRDNVVEMLIDGAYPAEVERLARLGWPVFGIGSGEGEVKPMQEDRHPVYRRLLRDPLRFYPIWREHLTEVLLRERQGMTLDEYDLLEPVHQAPILVLVEERLSDDRLTPADIQAFRECAHLVFHRPLTPNAQREHLQYQYEPPRRAGQSRSERAKKWHDHAMDALGYYAWHYTRSAYYADLERDASEIVRLVTLAPSEQYGLGERSVIVAPTPARREPLRNNWLATVREQHRPGAVYRGGSMLKEWAG